MYFVYAIYNKEAGKIYIGETEDLETRIKFHNNGKFKNSVTSRHNGRWELIYKEICKNRIKARKREKQLKSFRGRQFVKTHIPR